MKVKAYLVDEGVDSARLEAAGLGETDPASPNDTNVGRAANRRVELRIE
jgi:outer membrane protein OmpA-like peptidoglycan-associated protein